MGQSDLPGVYDFTPDQLAMIRQELNGELPLFPPLEQGSRRRRDRRREEPIEASQEQFMRCNLCNYRFDNLHDLRKHKLTCKPNDESLFRETNRALLQRMPVSILGPSRDETSVHERRDSYRDVHPVFAQLRRSALSKVSDRA